MITGVQYVSRQKGFWGPYKGFLAYTTAQQSGYILRGNRTRKTSFKWLSISIYSGEVWTTV